MSSRCMMSAAEAVLPAEPHVPILEFSVRYVGRAAPGQYPDRVTAMATALLNVCPPGVPLGPANTTLTVFTSGIFAATPETHGPVDRWWAAQDLVDCGAFRTTNDPTLPFQPITHVMRAKKKHASGDSVLFAMTFRRRDIPVVDAWVFACESDEIALTLVDLIFAIYNNRDGWAASPTDKPPFAAPPAPARQDVPGGSAVFQARGHERTNEWDGAIAKKGLTGKKQYLKDYYKKPELSGFFYAPTSSFVQKFNVSEQEDEFEEGFDPDSAEFEFLEDQNDGNNVAFAGDSAMAYGGQESYEVDRLNQSQFLSQDYIDPAESPYESRIIPQRGFGFPAVAGYDQFAEESPYELRLPTAAVQYGGQGFSAW